MNRHWIVRWRPARCSHGHGTGLLAALLAAMLLAGCGQKGPLWVPGYPKNTPWPMAPAAGDAKAAPPATPSQPAPAQSSPSQDSAAIPSPAQSTPTQSPPDKAAGAAPSAGPGTGTP